MQPPADWRSDQQAIVGRVRERRLLHELLAAARAGHGGVILIGGEAGIGKTTLVAELMREAAENGLSTLTGHCYDLTMTPPFGPWRDAFRDSTRQSSQSAAPVTLVAEHETGDAPSQALLFEQMHDLLVSMAADQPVLVVLEDLHWADAASLELLRFLARHASAHRLLFVSTYRDTELTRLHPLFQMLPLLVREAQAWRIDLRRLNANDVQALVAARYRLQADAETRLVAHLQAQAEGNPLFVGELLRTLEDEGFLALTSDGWVLRELDHVPIPPLVLQVIEGRLARLGEDTRTLLQIAAVIGHVVPVDVWQAVAEVDDEQLLAVIERGVEAHLLEAAGDDASVRFVHALVREAVYGGIMPTRRRNWHRQVAEALSVQPRPGPDAVALHFRLARDERAVDWSIDAGERALRLYAWITAADRFETAAQLLDGNESALRRRGWLLYRAGRLHRFSDPERSLALLGEAERVAESIGDPILAAIARVDHILPLDHLNHKSEALAAVERGIVDLLEITEDQARQSGVNPAWVADVPSSAATVARDAYAAIQSRQGLFTVQLANFGRLKDAVAVGEGFLASPLVSDGRVDPISIADALDGLAVAYAEFGQPDEAREAFERARAIGRRAGHNIGLAEAIMLQAFYIAEPYMTEDIVYRQRLAREAERLFRDIASTSPAGISVRVAWVPVWYLEGRWDDLLREAGGERRTASPVYAGRVARHQGRIGDAWALIHEVYPDGPGSGRSAIFPTVPFWELACALALDERGHDLARSWLESFDRDIEQSGRTRGKAESRLLWARYASLTGDATEARQHAEAALAHAREPRQPLVLIAAYRILGQFAANARDYATAERCLQSSLALADACAVLFERALTLLELAELRHASGRIDDARSLAAEVRSICVRLGAAPTLARVDAFESLLETASAVTRHPAGLSAREVEVLRLVAQGLTDAEVAEQLFLARRTVNTHLTSIYTKLGVSSRVAATRFAVEQGLT